MNILEDACAYLSGPIQFAGDHGVGWREDFKEMVEEEGISFLVIDPCDKNGIESSLSGEIGKEREEMEYLKYTGDFKELQRRMKRVRRWDLRGCDQSNFIVVHYDPDVPTIGTIDEIVTSERQQKPILAIIPGGPDRAPDWLFTIIRPDEMFDSIKACVNHLVKIDSGEIPADDRWVFIKPVRIGIKLGVA
tara:strand:- start:235 stop:807 length:573 start_codon:yes stop_codon:yes gene_type:complete